MENTRILVVGGAGYVGREIVQRLVEAKHDVTVLSRRPLTNQAVHAIQANLLDKAALAAHVKAFDMVIYLAAVVRSVKKWRYRENVLGLKNFLEVMRSNGLGDLIYFSTQNIYISKTGPYGDSKKQCEEIILKSDLNYIMLRPNYVYGIDRHNDFYRLAQLIKKLRICPILGNGNNRFQPVNKKDIADFTLDLISRGAPPKSILDLSGNTTISANQLVDLLSDGLHIKCLKLHLPLGLFRPFKRVLPFDLDGVADDRMSPPTAVRATCRSDLRDDLQHIMRLSS